MFKCKDCGSEYKEKPDYCDCGNDTFDEIKDETIDTIDKTEETKTQQQKESDNIKPKSKKNEKPIKTDKISLLIFAVCLILSIIILFFPVNTPVNTDNIKENRFQII